MNAECARMCSNVLECAMVLYLNVPSAQRQTRFLGVLSYAALCHVADRSRA